MKEVIWLYLLLLTVQAVSGQYYLRGEVRDQSGRTLSAVKIKLKSKGSIPYASGHDGSFGILVAVPVDSIHLFLPGYDSFAASIDTRRYQVLQLKMLPATAQRYNRKPNSVIPHAKRGNDWQRSVLGERYSTLRENDFTSTQQYPETGYSLNVDKASYSNTRRFLQHEMYVPPDAVRIEEMLNYFNFKEPEDTLLTGSFRCRTVVTNSPWNNHNKLLFINLIAPRLNLDSVPASNLVFLIDVSGSMDQPNRLPLLQSAFKLLVDNLRAKDTISMVTYGGNVVIALKPTSGAEKQQIRDAIDSLSAYGDTPGENAIRVAYSIAKKQFIPEGNNRVILATDGDFNVGQASEKELEELISSYRKTGIYLTCLGVGMGNYKDSKLESLSKKGNGNFAYIDQLREAEKVMVKEFTQTMFAVADDAFVQVRFSSQRVQSYRLIGFDNKKDAEADSISGLEGGEVGSGHGTMAVFELAPRLPADTLTEEVLAGIQLQYKKPGDPNCRQQHFTVHDTMQLLDSAESSYRFAASVVAFGQLLKRSVHIGKYDYEQLLQLAEGAVNKTDQLQNEFLMLIRKAIKVYRPEKEKRN
ncbi:MAG TPA: von Willebrand factor type A domain-containing protein [Sediminibacterium sp.]|nr:von Willebrand factor type A domain-containing protein [Sediminibacterium sp.]